MKILRNSQAQRKFCVSYIKKECKEALVVRIIKEKNIPD